MTIFDFTKKDQLSDADRECIEALTGAIEELNVILLGLGGKLGVVFTED